MVENKGRGLIAAFARHGLRVDKCSQLHQLVLSGRYEEAINHLDEYIRVVCCEALDKPQPKPRNVVKTFVRAAKRRGIRPR